MSAKQSDYKSFFTEAVKEIFYVEVKSDGAENEAFQPPIYTLVGFKAVTGNVPPGEISN